MIAKSIWTKRDEKITNASCSFHVGCIRLGYVYCIVRDTEIIPVMYKGLPWLKDRLIDELLTAINEAFHWDIMFHLNSSDGIA
jgi:hypothetical protein